MMIINISEDISNQLPFLFLMIVVFLVIVLPIIRRKTKRFKKKEQETKEFFNRSRDE